MQAAQSRYSASAITVMDEALIWAIALLLSISVIMVFSASIASAEATLDSAYFYLFRQLAFVIIALSGAAITFQVPVAVWEKYAGKFFLVALVLLVLVLIPGIGKVVNGSRRWINLPLLNFQPSELMKIAAVIYAADYTVRKASKLHSFREGFLPILGAIVAVALLLLSQPDFGALVVVMCITMGIVFLGGVNLRIFAGLALMAVMAVITLIITSPYRLKRVLGFLDPWEDPYGKGYQLSHSLIAIGRGEWHGVGLGGSIEKLFYLPEAHTDFIMAVISEEFGFIGICIVLGLYAWIVRRAFHIGTEAKKLERYYAALVAQGIGIWLAIQTFFNVGVNMGLLPTKGLTLPLMSYGGSALVCNLATLAILLRVDYENRRLMRGFKE